MQCLEKSPGKRPASAGELQRALRQVAARTRRRHGLLIAAAMVAALTVSAAVLQRTGVLARWGLDTSRPARVAAPPAKDAVRPEPGRRPEASPPSVAAAPTPQPSAVAAEPEHPAPKKVRTTRRHRH
jgi:hypothetical protein